ncbi:predicted protein [Postia placenta Mad-698-R]|nr:predicted protein [Postia placenta Mad-698-R]
MQRKLEDAIHNLDEAVGPCATPLSQQPPAKRPRTGKSLYATLAKYGIKKETKSTARRPDRQPDSSLSKAAPHLAAILARTALRTRKALPFKLAPAAPPTKGATASTTEYRPSSMQSFLNRLSTFKLATYANKPSAIDAVAAARLVCGICDISWVVAGREGMSRDAANALVEKQRAQLVDMHKDGCPWKTRQCDASIYRIPLQAPLAMAREVKMRAVALDAVLQGVKIKHPLTTTQTQSLCSTISSVTVPTFAVPRLQEADNVHDNLAPPLTTLEASETGIITALFGWAILPPAPPSERSRTHSYCRASSVAPATPTRALSRAPSVMSLRESTPTPTTPRRSPSIAPSSPGRTGTLAKADTTLLHCALCQRRIGLWAFISPSVTNGTITPDASTVSSTRKAQPCRQLDVLREHRSYCPYVVRSTTVPSLPAPPTDAGTSALISQSAAAQPDNQAGAMEGWRAMLTVVLRHGLARRQRLNGLSNGRRISNDENTQQEGTPMEVDRVEAMVAGVKSRGGKDLLKYVKGLLG